MQVENYNSAHDIIYDRMADSTFKVLSNYIERYYFLGDKFKNVVSHCKISIQTI